MGEHLLYKRVVNVTSKYLGPAADRFIDRHIENHLNKNPKSLKSEDLDQLIRWLKPAMGILTEDSKIVNGYIEELKSLIAYEPREKV